MCNEKCYAEKDDTREISRETLTLKKNIWKLQWIDEQLIVICRKAMYNKKRIKMIKIIA